MLNEISFYEANSLAVMSSNDYEKNIFYLHGYSKHDNQLMDRYFNSKKLEIQLFNIQGDILEIESYDWHSSDEEMNLTLYAKDMPIMPQIFSYIKIIDGEIENEYSIGDYQVYFSETSPSDSIMTTFSPFAFGEAPEIGEPFTVGYKISVNPNMEYDDIKFSVYMPDGYKAMQVEGISFYYDKTETEKHKTFSSVMKKNPDGYKHYKIYDVKITYAQIVNGNIQIQPLIIAETDYEKFYCKPFTPFNIHRLVRD